jgi:hypothetical protein
MKPKKKQLPAKPGPGVMKKWSVKKKVKSAPKIQPNPIMGSVWEVMRGEVDGMFYFDCK